MIIVYIARASAAGGPRTANDFQYLINEANKERGLYMAEQREEVEGHAPRVAVA
jgi:hypothetical protein